MGTVCVPSYVNIVKANFIAKHIYPYINKELSRIYLRSSDDIITIWKGTNAELITFIK